MILLIFGILLATLCSPAFAQITDYWIEPANAGQPLFFANNPTWTLGDRVSLQWVTDNNEYGIYLWQQSPTVGSASRGASIYKKIVGGTEQGKFNWTVNKQDFDLSQSRIFYFSLGPDSDDLTNATTSHYFNLTEVSNTALSTSTTTTTPTTTSSLTTTQPTTSSPAQTGSPVASPLPGQDLGLATKVGLGVGTGLGIPLLLIIAWLVWKKVRKPKHTRAEQLVATPQARAMAGGMQQQYQGPQEVHSQSISLPPYDHQPAYKHTYAQEPVEMPGEQARYSKRP